MFLQCVPSKHGNLHICHHKDVPKHHVLQYFQVPCLLKPLKRRLFTLFSSIFPCWPSQTYIQKNIQKTFKKHCFLECFCNVFRRKHRNLHVFRHTVGPKTLAFAVFSRLRHQKTFNSLISPNPWKHRYLHCFLQFLHVPMPLANSNIYTKIIQKHCFFFSAFIFFFRQKHYNLHVFRQLVGPKHWFLQCFRCSGIQKPFKILLFTVFFHLCPFFHCRKPTKMTQNSISIPSYAQTPKIVEKTRKHHQYQVSVRNRFCPPPS